MTEINSILPAEPNTLISSFIRHPVAANVLMILFVLLGSLGLSKLNKQIFPSFDLDYINVSIAWRGAAAEDVQASLIKPVEYSLRSLSSVREIKSQASTNLASITLELEPGADVNAKINDVKQRIDTVRNLPAAAETPIVTRVEIFKEISQLLIHGDLTLAELRRIGLDFEDQLLRRGISKIEMQGLPDEQLLIEIDPATLVNLGLSFQQIAEQIRQQNVNLPAGMIGRGEVTFVLRTTGQRKSVEAFERVFIQDQAGNTHRLGDIAHIERSIDPDQPLMYHGDQNAITLVLLRTEDDDALEAAKVLNDFVNEQRAKLPDEVTISLYNETWRYLKDRIELLLENGVSGLILVILTLFIFLNFRIAWWVTLGIPISLFATFFALHVWGGSINMISLFALIMSLGIIVDDAIVVGEETLAQWEQGANAFQAANRAAHRMLAPVMASSMTTIAAFAPLAMISGIMGKFMIEIPITIICVIIASLIESFLILPGHIYHSFRKLEKAANRDPASIRPPRLQWLQTRLDNFLMAFNYFRDNGFRRFVELAIHFRWVVLIFGFGMAYFAASLIGNGYVRQTFFPTIDGAEIYANVEFTAGTPSQDVRAFLTHLNSTLQATEQAFGGDLVKLVVEQQGANLGEDRGRGRVSQELGAMAIEIPTEGRLITNREFIDAWQERIDRPASLEKLLIAQPAAGPPGRSLDLALKGASLENVKAASLALQASLRKFQGVSNVDDNLPLGRPQLLLELTAQARQWGVNETTLISQIRASYDGELVDLLTERNSEMEIRLQLPKANRDTSASLASLPILVAGHGFVALEQLATTKVKRGIDVIRQQEGLLSVTVSADVDESQANSNEVLDALRVKTLPAIMQKYHVELGFEGRTADQAETMQDLGTGMILGLSLIYLILVWVFGSYLWPIAVMLAIPLGLTGAVLGHWLLSIDLSLFSMMGLFGLSGIVINDSIVLIVYFRELVQKGVAAREAIIQAICMRLRAVLLTSLTTIAGLVPILFETSLQAQYLIPMAVTLVFGLAYGTFLILFFIPAILTILESAKGLLFERVQT